MTLEELHNLVSELHERYEDGTEVFVTRAYGILDPDYVIAGHFEDCPDQRRIILVLADKPKAPTP